MSDSKRRRRDLLIGAAVFAIVFVVVVVSLFRSFFPKPRVIVLASEYESEPLVQVVANNPPADAMPPGLEGAALLYWQASDAITVKSPLQTNKVYPNTSVRSAAWVELQGEAWAANAKSRDLVHQARAINPFTLPEITGPSTYLNRLLSITRDTSDAADYIDSRGDHAQAIELIRDELPISDRLAASKYAVSIRVALDFRDLSISELMRITSGVVLTNDPADTKDLSIQSAHDLVTELVNAPTATTEVIATANYDRLYIAETRNRCNFEENLAAMSLACHIFRFDKGRWPNSLDELIPTYLPHSIVDPFGDGQQPLGYALIKGDLPDGSDRPLVYGRYGSADGLAFVRNAPHYWNYAGDGSDLPIRRLKQYGQFRDVSKWTASDRAGVVMEELP